ncbi:MAG: RNA-directed DNA polymerase, partial [Myxococcota bacterium]
MSRRSPNNLTHPPTSKQELYDRIRKSSKDEVIIEEMIRYGFWPRQTGLPGHSKSEATRLKAIQAELATARAQAGKLKDIDKLLKQRRTERMKVSREQRALSREKRILAAKLSAEDWRRRKKREILHLGEGVSVGLSRGQANVARLVAQDLPHYPDAAALAASMQLTVGQLRFLSYSRRVSSVSHYKRFEIPKKSGGVRHISAPMPRLKAAQRWILDHILVRVPLHVDAHGFRPAHSIVTNAAPHVGADVVINADLKDFFPSISYRRVLGMFRGLGYSHAIATILTLLCTEPRVTEVELDGATWFVARGERFLPQGAPTSPAVTNIICR